jgi:hypothetical protein
MKTRCNENGTGAASGDAADRGMKDLAGLKWLPLFVSVLVLLPGDREVTRRRGADE